MVAITLFAIDSHFSEEIKLGHVMKVQHHWEISLAKVQVQARVRESLQSYNETLTFQQQWVYPEIFKMFCRFPLDFDAYPQLQSENQLLR